MLNLEQRDNPRKRNYAYLMTNISSSSKTLTVQLETKKGHIRNWTYQLTSDDAVNEKPERNIRIRRIINSNSIVGEFRRQSCLKRWHVLSKGAEKTTIIISYHIIFRILNHWNAWTRRGKCQKQHTRTRTRHTFTTCFFLFCSPFLGTKNN